MNINNIGNFNKKYSNSNSNIKLQNFKLAENFDTYSFSAKAKEKTPVNKGNSTQKNFINTAKEIYSNLTNMQIFKDFEATFKDCTKLNDKDVKAGFIKSIWQAILRLFAPLF